MMYKTKKEFNCQNLKELKDAIDCLVELYGQHMEDVPVELTLGCEDIVKISLMEDEFGDLSVDISEGEIDNDEED